MNMMNYLKTDCWEESIEGIYVSKERRETTTFTDVVQDSLVKLENSSWWFQYRARVILKIMDRFFSKDRMTIDIGGGNGYTSSVVKDYGYKVGVIEPSLQACFHAKRRGIDTVCCGTVSEYSIEDESIEQALLLDVMEHIEDDVQFMDLIYRKLICGGYMVITVPASMRLWSSEDDHAGHYRRYSTYKLKKMLETLGFGVEYYNYFMSFAFLPVLIVRVFLERFRRGTPLSARTEEEQRKIAQKKLIIGSRIVSGILSILEWIEDKLLSKSGIIPFGSSLILAVQKRDGAS